MEHDIDMIRGTMGEISKVSTKTMVQLERNSQRLDSLEKTLYEMRSEMKEFVKFSNAIRETCILREDVYRRGKDFLDKGGNDPQTWWNKMTMSVMNHGMWIVLSVVLSTFVNSLLK
jgi:hypothetical protein